ncbi:uncharacterized protein LOC131636380 [Vicia villosa]|uniref:uncharacterized protein LOC131636380 n=1 Tax=Vicia villosa TaxID=3911 RepID=UPI00273B31DD|nr:uncharacterized protein LOC131636380 [Vicia villosa]
MDRKSRKDRYPDLYRLSTEKDVSVREAIKSEGGGSVWNGKWDSLLEGKNVRYEEEIRDKVQGISLRDGTKDKWRWHKNVYSVKEAYSVIMERRVTQIVVNRELAVVWNRLVPHKVSVLIWRIWQNKIPSRENLVKRGILPQSHVTCPYGFLCEENVAHVFFECPEVLTVWSEVYQWLGFLYVSHNSAVQNFVQGMIKFSKLENNATQMEWKQFSYCVELDKVEGQSWWLYDDMLLVLVEFWMQPGWLKVVIQFGTGDFSHAFGGGIAGISTNFMVVV